MWKKLIFATTLLYSVKIFAASPQILLKVSLYPGFQSFNETSNTNSCTIYDNGKLIINRNTRFPLQLTIPPSPGGFNVTETRSLRLTASDIKKAIALAAKSTTNENLIVDTGGLEYIAYQGSKVILLQDRGQVVHNSEWTGRFVTLIDQWCGDISK